MIEYIATFSISVFLFAGAGLLKKKQRPYVEIIAIIFLCLLAGLRARNIGTDTNGYLRPIIRLAHDSTGLINFLNSSFQRYVWKVEYVKDFEIGFDLVIYIVEKITGSIVAVQFVIQLFVVFPVYIVVKKRREIPVWLGMLVFILLMYNPSLNMIRQSIGMGLTLLSVQLWEEGKKRKTFFLSILAILFHTSAILVVVIIVLKEFVKKRRKKPLHILGAKIKEENINFWISVLIGVFGTAFAATIFSVLGNYGITRFAGYVTGKIQFMPNQVIARLPGLILIVYNLKALERKSGNSKFYLLMVIYEMLMGQFTSVNAFSGRIGQYFAYFSIISYSSSAYNSKHRRIMVALLILYLVFYWWFYFVYLGTNQTIPYQFNIGNYY